MEEEMETTNSTYDINIDHTAMTVKKVLDSFGRFLLEKNRRYGDSALSPINVFSSADAESSILVRIDDKISRIKNSNAIRKNDIVDLVGYLILFLVNKGWTSFDEFLD